MSEEERADPADGPGGAAAEPEGGAGSEDEGLPAEELVADQLASAVQVFQLFAGPVDARNSVFGQGGGTGREPGRPARRATDTGRLTEDDLADATTGYIRPAPYDGALALLMKHRVVELWGEAGTGKRAGAVVLLDELLDGPVFLLRPTLSLRQLAERDYRSGCGYVLPGRLGEGDRAEDTDLLWRRVRTTVREAGAHLVVTASVASPPSPWRVEWRRPDARALLLAGLGPAELPPGTVDEVLASVPADFRPQDLRTVARRLAAGEGTAAALEQFSLAASAAVADWFRAGPEPVEVLEVTALAFSEHTSIQEYEHGLAELVERMAVAVPSLVPSAEDGPDATAVPVLPASRAARIRPDGLIRRERLAEGVRTRAVMVFREPVYRRRVLAELNDHYDVAFWRGVSSWLAGRVRGRPDADPELRTAVASGLAELARLEVYEVENSCLHPWAAGQLGWAGQQTAVHTLWMMCRLDEGLAPVALSIAEGWVTGPNKARRWAGSVAFTGELGLRYPHEAAARLCGLVRQDERLRGMAQQALGVLFAMLTAEGRAATVVLKNLERMDAAERRRDPGAVFSTVLAVLSAPAERAGGLAVMHHLAARPDHAARLGRLWADLLRYRPLRRGALTALVRAVEGLDRSGGPARARARAEVARLGAALGPALPHRELVPLRRELTNLVAGTRQRPAPDELIEVLLAAVEESHGRPAWEEEAR
ncbi:hypothetical protein GCM10020229_49310 [Kitasatospora albolonga]|uniref:hypothetical protein n=1 Tax=Kitasatospora albolonga TaxID=68173 RepID=UPI0031E511F6